MPNQFNMQVCWKWDRNRHWASFTANAFLFLFVLLLLLLLSISLTPYLYSLVLGTEHRALLLSYVCPTHPLFKLFIL